VQGGTPTMDKKELRKLSKNELIQIIFRQQETITKQEETISRIPLLEKRIEELEKLLRAFVNPHTPSSKIRSKKNTEHDSVTRFPGKPEGSSGGGINMPKTDKEEHITQKHCHECGDKLGKPSCTYKFKQMDLVKPSFITTQYHVDVFNCSCGASVDSGRELHKGFYGPKATALMGVLKKEGLSFEAIAKHINQVYGLPITAQGVFGKITELTNNLLPERELIRQTINRSGFVHLDETGLRKDGHNGFAWTACIPQACLFEYDLSRSADVAKRILTDFSGAIITDDYKGYAWHNLRQLCWSHLLREAKEYSEKYIESATQYERLKSLYDKAKKSQDAEHDLYDKLSWELEDIATCYHPIDGCRRMHFKIHNRANLWLLGVKQKEIPLTNNLAERCLRTVVLQRNRIGCIRTEKGEAFVNIFLTCTSTWKLQGKNIYEELLKHAS
jgi:hypothetical protein